MGNKVAVWIAYALMLLGSLTSTEAGNMTIDELIDSFNYSYSNGSIDITTYQDYMRDANGNGANDTLVINLSTSGAGTFTFLVNLLDNGKLRINSTSKALSSTDTATIQFPSELLEAQKFNYTVEILNENSELVFRTNKIQTGNYGSYEGGLSLLSLLDQNVGNNYIEMSIQLNSTRNYTTNVTVVLAYNSSAISATEEETITSVVQTYILKFDNETLKGTHYSSNFTIDSVVVGDKVFDTNRNTSVYNFEDFAKTSYIKRGADGRIDSNSNGLFEYLEINFTVVSFDASTYTLSYDLYDEFDNFVANISKTQALSIGNNTVQTFINGSDIYKTKINGPYLVSFAKLSIGNDTKDILLDAHITNETFYTDYERPLLPDLNVSMVVAFDYTLNTTNITLTLKNIGEAPAFNVFLDIFDNTSYQNNRSASFMEVGESTIYVFNISNSTNSTLVTAIADFDNLVDEKNESNNIIQNTQTQSVTVSLAIDSITESYTNNTERIFEFIIYNDGSSTVYNISWQFDTGNNYIVNSTQNISSLAAGEKAFVYIAHNYSSSGSFTVKANATGITATASTLSASVSIGDLSITAFNVSVNATSAVFDATIKNIGADNLSSVNWSLSTGEATISSTSTFTLASNETTFVLAAYNYTIRKQHSATLTATSGSLQDQETITVDIRGIKLQSFLVLNESNRTRTFEMVVENALPINLTGVNWTLDTKNNNILNSTPTIILEPSEDAFVYVEYNFTASGTFSVNATAKNGTLEDSQALSIQVS
jgi:hypothetical protein